ncbi:MAG: agmatine deiminase family protein, partial [Pseudomonadota bacterium]
MFRMPAEWMPHDRCWMIWPRRIEVWGDRFDATKRAFARVARTIARFEPVTMIVHPEDRHEAETACGAGISLFELPVDDSWARDSGPCFVHDGEVLGTARFDFNAWGGKYHPHDLDAAMAGALADALGLDCRRMPFVGEGGAISVDGQGTLITTESCLLNANRNPGLSKAAIEAELGSSLGVEKVIWLPGNPAETETDGHVDGIAVFAGPGHVLVEAPSHPDQPGADTMRANIEALRGQVDATGRELRITEICEAINVEPDGERFCRSYINFYLANGAVIAPEYGIPEDHEACRVLASTFPDREIVLLPIG